MLKRTCPVELFGCDPFNLMGFFIMKFLEKDLEQIIYESGIDAVNKKGLPISGKMLRQLKIGNYGIADLITFERPFIEHMPDKYKIRHQGIITIYELKRDKISISAFLQAVKYAKGIQSYLENRGKLHLYDIKIILIGREIDVDGAFCYLPEVINGELDFITFYTYTFGIDGIAFTEKNGYCLKNEGF